MENNRLTADRVVDLLRYKQERSQRRLDFEAPRPPRPALAPITPFRTLTAREVAHRQLMVSHLRRQR